MGPGCYLWRLRYPNSEGHRTVSNARGWAIETRLPMANITGGDTACHDWFAARSSGVSIMANDHTIQVVFAVALGEICSQPQIA
jgi:hypothetical protein